MSEIDQEIECTMKAILIQTLVPLAGGKVSCRVVYSSKMSMAYFHRLGNK
ncbi:MAG: hypothetical protein JEZ00_07220 [Anaerolineaceae bacterium]|nr:hypothetical protein [Anaerolineaceae bacterium]